MIGRVSRAQMQAAVSAAERRAVQKALEIASSRASSRQPVADALSQISALSPSNDDVLQKKAGAWTNRTPAQVKADLSLTKNDVGLANVDNTSDANKPISTATQTALDGKMEWTTVPASAAATGTAGQIAYESGWLYVCVATDTWERTALTTW
jgi:hypothetical protein